MKVRSSPARRRQQVRNIFFHMPKTAGQTLINVIGREYADRMFGTQTAVLTPGVWDWVTGRLAALPPDQRHRNRAVTGRMKFGVHELLPGRSQYLTFVRDPVNRFLSFYQMTKRLGLVSEEHRFDLARADWNRPAEDWFTREIDNGQTRALADAPWDLPFGGCGEEHYQAAMANLEKHFVFIGLAERFDLSLRLLTRFCGWRTHFYVAKNVAPKRDGQPIVAPEVRAAIEKLNVYDQRIHAYARARFEQQVRAAGPMLWPRYVAFKAGNAVHGELHRRLEPWRRRRKLRRQQRGEQAIAREAGPLLPTKHLLL